VPTPNPSSKETTQHDAAATPLTGATAINAGKTLIQSPGSQFSSFLSAPMTPEELGRLGGFRILRLVGQGGMGFVFEGEDLKLQRRVAVKVMRPDVAQLPDAVSRFLREARTAAALVSDHVVTIHHVDEQNGIPFLVMPLMAGESLHERLHREPISIEEGVRIARQCAEGLAAAHAADLIHRDIKPANLWLEAPSGRVKILDFGLARGASRSDITRSGEVLGTPQYMSPEQARGKTIDARADLFSLGAVMYRMATGREAFTGSDVLAVLSSLAMDDPPPPRNVNPKVPAALSTLILQLLSKDASRRPASAQEVVDTLRSIEAGESKTLAESASSTPSRLLPSTNSLPIPDRRRWAIALPAAIVGGIALAFLARNAFQSNPSNEPVSKTEVAAVKEQPKQEQPKDEPKPSPPPVVEKPVLNPNPPVEKAKNEPPPSPPPKPSIVRLAALAPISIEAGKTADVAIEIERENLPGEVTLTITDLPAGVSMEAIRFAPGVTKLNAQLKSSASAPFGAHSATVVASSGSATDRRELPITIRAPIVPKLIASIPTATKIKTGSASIMVASVEREHLTGAVKLEWLDLPPGVSARGATLIPEVGQKTQVTLAADYTARGFGTARLRASVGDVEDVRSIEIEIERVAPPILDSTKSAVAAADVKAIQQNWADYLGKPFMLTVPLGNTAMEFMLIPPGEFMMGTSPDDAEGYPDEQPRHKRRVTKPFYLGRTLVNKEQFHEFVKEKKYVTEAEESKDGAAGLDVKAHQLVLRNPKLNWRDCGFPQPDDHPVVNVSVRDIERFCDWLSTRQSMGKVHLPSEAQWEYSCRAGGTTRYINGDDPYSLNGFANVSDQSLKDQKLNGTERWRYFDFNDSAPFTSPVGHFRGNNFALRDMIGNVWQWTADSFDTEAYKTPPPDERPWTRGNVKERIVRGGSWNTYMRDTRTSCRDRNEVHDRQANVGFRVALRLE
jgi:formylglycine-generating enzyme required for sulfatase activity/serine/threonine protein kinase